MSNRKIDNLREPSNLQLKVKTGYPTAIDAKEGVVTLRYIPGTGLALFAYYANKWSMTKLSNMNAKDESIVENLKVKNLEIDKSAKFNASSVNISEKNIPSIRKWDKSYNDIRSGEIEANFKKTKVKEDLQIGPDNNKILLKNNSGALNIRNAADDGDITLATTYTAAKCTDATANNTATALKTLVGESPVAIDIANDSIIFGDADGVSAGQPERTVFKSISTAMAGDGLAADGTTGVLSVGVDNSTVEINSDALRVKAGAITTSQIAAGTLVAELEGIGSNDNDTTIPTSAAVKDYVDNNAGGTFSGSITTNQIAHGSGTNALQGTDNFSFSNGLLSMTTSDASSQKPRLTFLNSNANDESGTIYFNNTSASPAMNDKLMQIYITGKNNAGTPEDITYATIKANILSFADDNEASYMDFKTMANGSERTLLSLYGDAMLVQGTDGNTAFKIKSSADAGDFFGVTVDTHGATTIATEDDDAIAANLTLDIDGDIELNADGGDIVFKDDTASLATINSDGLTINNISSGDGSGENFLVEESGVVKKRTAAQTLNDIGAMPDSGDITIAGTLSITDTGSPPLKVAYDANHFATFDMDTNGVLEIECTDGGSAESKLQLKNGGTTSDQYLVWGNSSETARITSNGAQNLVLNTNEGTDSGYIELQDAANGDISIIPNGTGDVILGTSTGSVQFATTTFLDGNGNAMFGTAVASSAVNNVELGNAATGNAATLKATGTDTNVPLTVSTKGTGAVTIDSGGDIALDAASGNFTAKKSGVEFSAANSAYAGMVLGYTYIQPSSTVLSFEIQNALTVEDDGHKITFKTPPSQKVEIEVTAMINCSSSDTRISVGLSSANATDGYSSVAGQFEYDSSGIFFTDDEVDDHVKTFKFVVEAANLAAVGSDNTFWIGFSTSNSTKTAYLTYGYRSTHGIANHPFIIKATALPATIYDGS
tara:strand:+ start:15621 stop:18464 length:2844 start_codon:yes stop_codon:yes gene_type:complete